MAERRERGADTPQAHTEVRTFTFVVDLTPGLSARELERRFLQADRVGDMSMRVKVFCAWDMTERRTYRQLGFSDVAHYARTRLGVEPKTFEDYARTGQRLEELPVTDQAFRDGELCWTSVRAIASVATPDTDADWAAWARGKTSKVVESEVALRERGQKPRDPDLRRIHHVKVPFKAKLLPDEHRALEATRFELEARWGRPVNDHDLLLYLHRSLPPSDEGGAPADGERDPAGPRTSRPHDSAPNPDFGEDMDVDAEPDADQGVTGEGVTGEGVTGEDVTGDVPGEDSPVAPKADVDSEAWTYADFVATLEEPVRPWSRPATSLQALWSMLDPANAGPVVPQSERDAPTPPKLRHAVHVRDGFRCRVCGCSRRLSAHHVCQRSRGGLTVAANLITLCENCHSNVHAGFLIVRGPAAALEILDDRGAPLERRPALPSAFRLPPRPQPKPSHTELARSGPLPDPVGAGGDPAPVHPVTPSATDPATRGATDPVGDVAADPVRDAATDPVRVWTDPASDTPTDSGMPGLRGSTTQASHARGVGAGLDSDFVEEPPRSIDAATWHRVQHLFTWDARRGGFQFESGIARGARPPARRAPPAADAIASLRDGIGHRRVRERLALGVAASQREGRALGHTLLTGPPGVGKSSLARSLAEAGGAGFHGLLAPAIRSAELVVRQLAALQPGDVVFLDELHRLPEAAAELLYDAMERGELNLPVAGEGWTQATLRLELPPFTLIGATTEPERLPAPLRDRFAYREELTFYARAELVQVIQAAATRAGLGLSDAAAERLVGASQDTPRDALGLLWTARDVACAEGRDRIEVDDAARALAGAARGSSGLDALGTRYLRALAEAAGCLGLRTIAAKLGAERETTARVIEPFLIRRGWVEITWRGRLLTEEGWRMAEGTRASRRDQRRSGACRPAGSARTVEGPTSEDATVAA